MPGNGLNSLQEAERSRGLLSEILRNAVKLNELAKSSVHMTDAQKAAASEMLWQAKRHSWWFG